MLLFRWGAVEKELVRLFDRGDSLCERSGPVCYEFRVQEEELLERDQDAGQGTGADSDLSVCGLWVLGILRAVRPPKSTREATVKKAVHQPAAAERARSCGVA